MATTAAAVGEFIDRLTGGAVTATEQKVDDIEFALRLSTYAAVASAAIVIIGVIWILAKR